MRISDWSSDVCSSDLLAGFAELRGKTGEARLARFVSALTLLRHADDPVPLIALGYWNGRILEAPRGANGFGYDPLFFVPEQGCRSAELAPDVKNSISHPARASAELLRPVGGE